VSVVALKTRIIVECLRCGHCGTIREHELPLYGEKPGAPIVSIIKRLVCHECGSQSVKAYRKVEDAGPLSPA
jgi:hypothetical protein